MLTAITRLIIQKKTKFSACRPIPQSRTTISSSESRRTPLSLRFRVRMRNWLPSGILTNTKSTASLLRLGSRRSLRPLRCFLTRTNGPIMMRSYTRSIPLPMPRPPLIDSSTNTDLWISRSRSSSTQTSPIPSTTITTSLVFPRMPHSRTSRTRTGSCHLSTIQRTIRMMNRPIRSSLRSMKHTMLSLRSLGGKTMII